MPVVLYVPDVTFTVTPALVAEAPELSVATLWRVYVPVGKPVVSISAIQP
jgi:hypothetical protein